MEFATDLNAVITEFVTGFETELKSELTVGFKTEVKTDFTTVLTIRFKTELTKKFKKKFTTGFIKGSKTGFKTKFTTGFITETSITTIAEKNRNDSIKIASKPTYFFLNLLIILIFNF